MAIVNHHIKYKEIHGVDEFSPMDKGEHIKLHRRLRKEGKCNIPPKELALISSQANYRIRTYRVCHVSETNKTRLQKFGVAGESINDALKRVLDIAEKHHKE